MEHTNTKIVTEYVYGGPEYGGTYSDLWPTDHPAQEVYHYSLYEEEVAIEVDLDTGQYRYVGFAGNMLAFPTPWYGSPRD